jgi:hypothetical protein
MNLQHYSKNIEARHAVLAFSGWADAGRMAQLSVAELRRSYPSKTAAAWDLDGYWHTEQGRPRVHLQHGRIQRLDWPTIEFTTCRPPEAEPILLGVGPEPTMRWRDFSRELHTFLEQCGCERLILIGSITDQIFHDEVIISAVVQDAASYNLVRELGCEEVEYTGPAAVHSAILTEAERYGIQCVSLWTHFPFYLGSPHELLLARLLRMVCRILDFDFREKRLLDLWKKREREIEDNLRNDNDLSEIVQAMKRGERPNRKVPPAAAPKVVRLDDFLKKRQETDPD